MACLRTLIFVAFTVIEYPFAAVSQDVCTWSSSEGKTHATDSDADYAINSTTTLSNGVAFTWTYAGATVAQFTYSGGSFSKNTPFAQYEFDAVQKADDLVTLTALIKKVTSADNGATLRITRTPCTSATTLGASIILTVADCPEKFYGPFAYGNTSSCGFGCNGQLTCNTSACFEGTFQAECQASALWNPAQHSCQAITCLAPRLMQFAAGALNAGCENTLEVLCEGGFDFCGSTNGTCATTGVIELENTTFDCSETCSVTTLQDVARSFSLNNPRCGENATFQCFENSTCEDVPSNFTRQCGRNGVWREGHPCFKTCPRLNDAWIAFIVLMILWIAAIVVLLAVARKNVLKRERERERDRKERERDREERDRDRAERERDELEREREREEGKIIPERERERQERERERQERERKREERERKREERERERVREHEHEVVYRKLAAVLGSILKLIGMILLIVNAVSSDCCDLEPTGIAGVVLKCLGQAWIWFCIIMHESFKGIKDNRPENNHGGSQGDKTGKKKPAER